MAGPKEILLRVRVQRNSHIVIQDASGELYAVPREDKAIMARSIGDIVLEVLADASQPAVTTEPAAEPTPEARAHSEAREGDKRVTDEEIEERVRKGLDTAFNRQKAHG